jgi:transposase
MIALACSDPARSGQPISQWSIRQLCQAAVRLGHVASIAYETLRRWLETADLHLQRCRQWLHSTDPLFDQRMGEIVELYTTPPDDGLVYCLDERTGLQALERWHPDWPVRPGKACRREFHYRRHGTLTLIGCFEVATGRLLGQCYERNRGEEFLAFLRWLIPQLPRDRALHFVVDNYATHKRRDVLDFVASFGGRAQLHFTPTHASWLNQIELWFGVLNRQLLHRGNFTSREDLAQKVEAFISHYNQSDAHPYRWTYTGQPRAT